MAPLDVKEARRLLLAEVRSSGAESVPLERCVDRVTAAPVRAASPLPSFDNSAMDGFAVRSADLAEGSSGLRIVGESRAGQPAVAELQQGEAMRISTGAMVPIGADAVVPLEEAREEGDTLHATMAPVAAGAHLRRAGEDLEPGEQALPAGTRIGASELGVLAALGLANIQCARRPSLVVMTSGDELLTPGDTPQPGQIFDSSRFSLVAQAAQAGAEPVFAGSLSDDLARTREAITGALDSDFVVLAGGVSVGRHDHVKAALAELGVEQLFWRVALRPGGPTWGGVLRRPDGRSTMVFGLPGNPVSAMVTFRLFVHPAVLAATGCDAREERVTVTLAGGYTKAAGRAHYLRCRLEAADGGWRAVPTRERQGSHVLSSMLGARCLAVIPADREQIEADEPLEALLL